MSDNRLTAKKRSTVVSLLKKIQWSWCLWKLCLQRRKSGSCKSLLEVWMFLKNSNHWPKYDNGSIKLVGIRTMWRVYYNKIEIPAPHLQNSWCRGSVVGPKMYISNKLQVVLMLLIWGPHFENHYPKERAIEWGH